MNKAKNTIRKCGAIMLTKVRIQSMTKRPAKKRRRPVLFAWQQNGQRNAEPGGVGNDDIVFLCGLRQNLHVCCRLSGITGQFTSDKGQSLTGTA